MRENPAYYLKATLLGGTGALESGYGKTVSGADLIGGQERKIEVAPLGVVLTLTPTVSVIFLAVMAKPANLFLDTLRLPNRETVASAALIVTLGAWTLYGCAKHLI